MEVAYQLPLSKVKVLLAGRKNSGPVVEEHRLRFLMGGVADGLTGGGRGYGGGGGGAVLAAFVLRAANFLMEVIQFLDKGIDVVEVVQIIPQERIQLRIVELIFDVPVPQVVEEILEVIKVIPQERIVEQIVDVPVLQVFEEIVEVVRLFF